MEFLKEIWGLQRGANLPSFPREDPKELPEARCQGRDMITLDGTGVSVSCLMAANMPTGAGNCVGHRADLGAAGTPGGYGSE